MPIQYTCECGKKLKISDHLAGRKVKCPACGNVIDVPATVAEKRTSSPSQISPSATRPSSAARSSPTERPSTDMSLQPPSLELLLEMEQQSPSQAATKACPFCSETILATAKKCKHCNEFLDGQAADNKNASNPFPAIATVFLKDCPSCGCENLESAKKCKQCGKCLDIDLRGPAWGIPSASRVKGSGKDASSAPSTSPFKYAIFLLAILLVVVAVVVLKDSPSLQSKDERKETQQKTVIKTKADDPVSKYRASVDSLVQSIRAMTALREIGGNISEHRQQILQMATAIATAKRVPMPDDTDCSTLLKYSERSLENYKAAVEAWNEVIQRNAMIGSPLEKKREDSFKNADFWLGQASFAADKIDRKINSNR